METALSVFLVAALLIATCFWWIRRNNLALYAAGHRPRFGQPLPACQLGVHLMAAPSVGRADGGTVSPPRPLTGVRPSRSQPARRLPSRRDFFRLGLLTTAAGAFAAFGGASLGFLWPSLRGGFGARLPIGDPAFVKGEIQMGGGQFAYPAGRMYLVEYDTALDPGGQYADITNGTGFMALYQKCVHLGCRVPWCSSSHWFECPCHGSRYNRWGEYQFGPAPRGLDRFNLVEEDGQIVVDTSTVITGPSRGGGTLNQSPEGPHCT